MGILALPGAPSGPARSRFRDRIRTDGGSDRGGSGVARSGCERHLDGPGLYVKHSPDQHPALGRGTYRHCLGEFERDAGPAFKCARWPALFILAGASILFLGVSGAITALGDTLFQSTSIAEGFRQDFASQSHLFLRLRIWHPVIAVLVSVALLLLCYRLVSSHFSVCVSQLAFALAGTIITQLGVGMINLALLAPIALQLLHLLLADAAWIAFVLLGAEVLFHEETPGPGSVPTYPAELLSRA